MKLKIFTDFLYLPKSSQIEPIFYPFYPNALKSKQYSWERKFETYLEAGCSFFDIAPLDEADIAVLPMNWAEIRGHSWRSKANRQAEDLSTQFERKVKQAGKPLVIFFAGDCSNEEISIKDAIVFRQGLYRFSRKTNDHVVPPFVEDIVKLYYGGKFFTRQKRSKPVIGFCGLARQNSWSISLKTLAYHGHNLAKFGRINPSPYKGEVLRSKGLEILARSSLVDVNFIIRNHSVFLNETDCNQKQKVRYEFVNNIMMSDYILNCRGSGNFSIRLIETLCCGRIPIFINTECALPYDFAIDWKKYCIWVDEKELPHIAEKVYDFHKNLSDQEFLDLQYECRKIWKEYLSPEGFFANFYRHFSFSQGKNGELIK